MMPLPIEPGVYHDVRGDEWMLRDDGRWQYTAHRMMDGRMWPVSDRQILEADTLEELGSEPGAEVLPLKPVTIDPPWK